MFYPERDVRVVTAALRATRERVCELIRDKELASSHQLEQMRHVRMLEKQAAWKREGSFDRIEIVAEIHEQTLRRLHAGFNSEPLHSGLYNSRRRPTTEDFRADMNVEVGSLRLEIYLRSCHRRRIMICRNDSCLRPVRGWTNPKCRILKFNKQSRREVFLFKPASMALCTLIASWTRTQLSHFKQTSG